MHCQGDGDDVEEDDDVGGEVDYDDDDAGHGHDESHRWNPKCGDTLINCQQEMMVKMLGIMMMMMMAMLMAMVVASGKWSMVNESSSRLN